MSKKTVLKWLCATATICSLHAGAVVVSAEDATPQPVATSETRETPAETLPTENQAATPDSTEVTEPVQAAPSETTAGDVESPVDNDKNPERKPEANTDKSDKKSPVTDKTPTTQGAVATLPKTGTKENASLTILGFLSLVAGLVLLPLRKNHH